MADITTVKLGGTVYNIKDATALHQGDVAADNASLGNGYGVCSVAATTTAKTATLTGYTLATGGRVSVRCTTSNTVSAPTMNINSQGAKAMYVNGAASSSSNSLLWDEGAILELVYDGTQYQVVDMPVPSADLTTLLNEF